MSTETWTPDADYRTETLERTTPHGLFRAVIERGDYPQAPHFFAGDPILDTQDGGTVVYGGETETGAYRPVERIALAYRELDDTDVWERYVRAFHGGTVSWLNGGSRGEEGRYAALALPEYRKLNGWTDEHLSDPAETTEWTAYVEGDVYGIRVERATFDADGDVESWTECEDTEVWGHYGETYAKESAEAMLSAEVAHVAAGMLPVSS